MIKNLKLNDYGSPILDDTPQNAEIQGTILKCFYTVRDHGKIMCSISGGYDSDIMLDMIERCGGHEKTTYVFNDTGLEYDATKRHLEYLKAQYGIDIKVTKPKKAIPACVREYGVPFWSKYVSGMIARLQKHGFQWEDEPFETLYQRYPRNKSSLRWWCNGFKTKNGKVSKFNIEYVRGLKEFIVANPPTFKISPRCCDIVKKDPAHGLLKAGNFNLNCVGVRRSEGGARSTSYTSCYDDVFCGPDQFRPLFWTTGPEKELYRKFYGIRRSDCYEVWGMKRTGCAGCPFGKDFEAELRLAEQYEPKMQKAMLAVFGQSYDYTRRYLSFRAQLKGGQTMSDNSAQDRTAIIAQLRKDGYMDAAELIEQLTAEPTNDPLTREELDGLNGAWVWVVAEEDPEPIHMQINTDSGIAAPSHAEYCTFDNYGPGADGYYGWVAYRRKPEEGEQNV